ncbi:hypothetical protein HU200_020571 [Digitaria exilis]|uniref:Uncharacterized protein n=1 Tax=Digitaria exilis TaxID=1010633 RepID=A0A835KEV9_9POAL|nr:hypothetical protein HU200_020571 [Digitaria exilis]CAB3464067.1 unnamed protein product [Digitaria exilis]
MASAGGGKEEPGLVVKQGSKLHAKLLSKEAAAQLAAPSFRVYYSVASAGAVPFLWESQPGTPKNDSPSAAALTPPLTPPPSYYSSSGASTGVGGRSGKRRPAGIIGAILRRGSRPGGRTPTSSASSWSSSSWSSSSSQQHTPPSMSPVFAVQSSPGPRGHHRRAFSAGGDEDDAAPRCFWAERDCCQRGVVKGCGVNGVAAAVRNALATVVGGGKKPGRRGTAA